MKRFLSVILLLTACEKSETHFSPVPSESTPREVASTNQAPLPENDAGVAVEDVGPKPDLTLARPISLEGTPYDNVEGVMVLKYEGPTGEFDLYRAVGDRQSVAGKAHLESGMIVDIRRSMVLVSEPRLLTAKHDLDVIATRWDRVASRTGKEDIHQIKQGAEVKLLKAVNDGQCWMAIAADEFVAGCPIPEDFEGEGWTGEPMAVASEWWVKTAIGGARGWLPIDEVSFSWEFKTKKRR